MSVSFIGEVIDAIFRVADPEAEDRAELAKKACFMVLNACLLWELKWLALAMAISGTVAITLFISHLS